MDPKMAEVYKQFMKGEKGPKRSGLFRFKYWLLARLCVLGEWALSKIAESKVLTPLEQLYLACTVAGYSPDQLRKKLELANSAMLDIMAKSAAVRAAKDGVVQ